MTARARLVVSAAAVAAALGGGLLTGRVVGPMPDRAGQTGMAGGHAAMPHMEPDAASVAPDKAPTGARAQGNHVAVPGGVAMAQAGFLLEPLSTLASGESGEVFGFRIAGPDDADVAALQPRPQGELSLVLVSRDLTGYHRLLPSRTADGSWATTLPDLPAGAHRLYADFAPFGGPELVLGTDILVPGDAPFQPLVAAGTSVAVDGYEVALDGTATPTTPSEVQLTVTQDGVPVGGLSPWFGPRGHLLVVRAGDLAAVRAEPVDDATAGPASAAFTLTLPSAGDYRLFYEFAVGEQMHMAAFAASVPAADPPEATLPVDDETMPMEGE